MKNEVDTSIQYIPIDRLNPHPDNPRKDVGDVTELAESIKANGILQNLTVVPYESNFRVIIGHRRLEAAKLAGIKVLPCVVVEMTEKEQISTMLTSLGYEMSDEEKQMQNGDHERFTMDEEGE